MVNEKMLLEALIGAFDYIKAQYGVTSAIMGEVAALRQAVRGLDPTFDEVMEQRRKENPTDALSEAMHPKLDEIILRLKAELIQ